MKTKSAALFLAASMLLGFIGILGLSGCADTTYALSVSGTEVKAGEYIYAQLEAAQEAVSKFKEENPDTDVSDSAFDYFKQELEGKKFTDWVNDSAVDVCRERMACAELFDELGLTLTADDETEIRNNVESFWANTDIASAGVGNYGTLGEFFESSGIGKASLSTVLTYQKKKEKVFHAYFDADGIEAVSESELRAKMAEEYARFRAIPIYLSDGEGNAITSEEGLKEIDGLAQSYVERLSAGESFVVVQNDYSEYVDSLTPVAEEEETGETAETTDGEEAAVDAEAEAETDNDYDLAEKKGSPYYLTETEQEFLFGMDANTAAVYKGDTYYYVIQRLDINEREDWFENISESLLHEIKDATMIEKIRERADLVNVTLNQAAIKRYKPQTIAKKGIL